jgi:predicted nucleotidyltransferase
MINKKTLEEIKNRLIKTYNPIAIYLFGSYAWGKPTKDSDLDLLIIIDKSDEKSYKRQDAAFDALFDLNFSKDIIVYTKEEFDAYSRNKTTFGYKIKKDGTLLYARA